jgi:hypothetical protein
LQAGAPPVPAPPVPAAAPAPPPVPAAVVVSPPVALLDDAKGAPPAPLEDEPAPEPKRTGSKLTHAGAIAAMPAIRTAAALHSTFR